MPDRLIVTSIPVGHGDSTLIEWQPSDGKPFHILVDGGPKRKDQNVNKILAGRDVDLLVLSHVDADHIDGLFTLESKVESYWGPCTQAFDRYRWLFPKRVMNGIAKAKQLEASLDANGTRITYPLEGFSLRSPDRRLKISVLSPAARVLERVLLENDALKLFTAYPMPQGWLLGPDIEEPEEEPVPHANLRRKLRAEASLAPEDFESFTAAELAQGDPERIQNEWATTYKQQPEFFGNHVLNDTSLVLRIDALVDGSHPRSILLPGDLENWLYLSRHDHRVLQCDILKAPHHGGRVYIEDHEHDAMDDVYQFLRPQIVLVSATGTHKLPRSDFRNAVRRWGGHLFCPNVRRVEPIVGGESKDSCFKTHDCDDPPEDSEDSALVRTTRITLDARSIQGDRPACVTGSSDLPVRIVKISQQIIEPSSIVERFTESELLKHLGWVERLLSRLHDERRSTAIGTDLPAITADTIVAFAKEEGRFQLAEDVGVVLNRGRRQGRFWANRPPDRRSDHKREAYMWPRQKDVRKAAEALTAMQVVIFAAPRGSYLDVRGPLEMLDVVDKRALVGHLARSAGYPTNAFSHAAWPQLRVPLREETYGYLLENYDWRLLVLTRDIDGVEPLRRQLEDPPFAYRERSVRYPESRDPRYDMACALSFLSEVRSSFFAVGLQDVQDSYGRETVNAQDLLRSAQEILNAMKSYRHDSKAFVQVWRPLTEKRRRT